MRETRELLIALPQSDVEGLYRSESGRLATVIQTHVGVREAELILPTFKKCQIRCSLRPALISGSNGDFRNVRVWHANFSTTARSSSRR